MFFTSRKKIGCSKLQGYYYSKPTPLSRIMETMDAVAAHDLENPEEGKYYETIGRTNLYDFSVFADEDDSLFQNIFSTIPMGIIEVSKDEIKYIRANRSYREFLNRFLGIRISDGKGVFSKSQKGFSPAYIKTIERCCETDSRVMFNDQMPDGSRVHSFLKRISVNSVSNSVAIAIAILSIASPDEGAAYADIARALATDYYNIYYVDLETDRFIEYSLPSSGEAELAFERHGEDFFSVLREDALSYVHEEDLGQFLDGLFKENIVKEVNEHGSFMKTFRMLEDGMVVYAEMKISRMYPGGKHLIIGISVTDSNMKQKEILDRIQKERDTMTRVMALTDGYLALYTINAKNNHYVEYTASKEYESLVYPKKGDDFFRQGIIDGKRTVWKDDLPFYLEKFTKQQVMDGIRRDGKYRLSYSLVIQGKLKQVSLIIVPLNEGEDEILLAGVREEDSMRCLR